MGQTQHPAPASLRSSRPGSRGGDPGVAQGTHQAASGPADSPGTPTASGHGGGTA